MNHPVFDVLVIGAGPSGATCAWKCAEAGLSTLLLDRAPTLPRYKPCGGGVPSSLSNHIDGLDPEAFADVTVTKLRHSWKGKDPVLAEMTRADGTPAEVWMVQRPTFDNWIVERARRAGACVEIGAKVSEIDSSEEVVKVTTAMGESYYTRHVVGADGAKGIVGTRVGLRLKRRYGIAREAEIPFESETPWHAALEPAACYLDYGTVRNGYAWIFPKGGYLSVGAGMLLPSKPAADVEKNVGRVLKRAMETLMESVGLTLPDGADAPRIWGHPIPFWSGSEPLTSPCGRILLVGDAAGLVQPLFGEGIQYAVRSGQIAADSIASNTVNQYTKRIVHEFADEFDSALRVGKLFHKSPLLSYKLGVKNPAGTRLVGRLMSGDANLVNLEDRIFEKIRRPFK